jgi:hypothetical protein
MKNKIAFTLAFGAIAMMSLFAAEPQSAKEIQREEMKKLDWLVGRWKGSGWIDFGKHGRREFTQTESIESRLGGLVLVIEGTGKEKEGGATVHNALAVVSYDQRGQVFRWRAFTADGGQTDTKAKVASDTVMWELQIPQRGRMRYTIKRKENGGWFEVGEFSQDNESWEKFFEMTLQKEK